MKRGQIAGIHIPGTHRSDDRLAQPTVVVNAAHHFGERKHRHHHHLGTVTAVLVQRPEDEQIGQRLHQQTHKPHMHPSAEHLYTATQDTVIFSEGNVNQLMGKPSILSVGGVNTKRQKDSS